MLLLLLLLLSCLIFVFLVGLLIIGGSLIKIIFLLLVCDDLEDSQLCNSSINELFKLIWLFDLLLTSSFSLFVVVVEWLFDMVISPEALSRL